MIFSPHILQIKTITPPVTNSYGDIITKGTETWVNVCRCRCEDNTTKEFKSKNGEVYRPSYHIVTEKVVNMKAQTLIRCVDDKGNIRGEGNIYLPKDMNYFDYSELYV